MTKVRSAPGGGRIVEVDPGRLTGWINRFGARNAGLASITHTLSSITLRGGNDTTAVLDVPFPPMAVADADADPVAALLAHLDQRGTGGILLLRGGAYSVGTARQGMVVTSSTDSRYLQSRTAAGGWSQQRYARRRGNQRRDAHRAAARAARRVLGESSSLFTTLTTGGDAAAIAEVLQDPALAPLCDLPRRHFPDIPEPRRAVLDAVAKRSRAVQITITDGDATTGT